MHVMVLPFQFDLFHHMEPSDKKGLLHNLRTIESIFLEIFGESQSLHKLQENIFQLKTIIEESFDDVTTGTCFWEQTKKQSNTEIGVGLSYLHTFLIL